MELGQSYAVIMTNSGEFLKVASKKNETKLGEIFTGESVKNTPFYKYALTAASLVFMLLFGSSVYAYYTPSASVRVDINPSIKLDINRWNKIIKYNALNSDGEKVLSGINLKNKSINDGLSIIVEEAKKDNFINDKYINDGKIINVTISNNKNVKSIDLSQFNSYIGKNNLKVNVNETVQRKEVKPAEKDSSSKVNPASPNAEKDNSNKNSSSEKENKAKPDNPSETNKGQDNNSSKPSKGNEKKSDENKNSSDNSSEISSNNGKNTNGNTKGNKDNNGGISIGKGSNK